MHIMPSKFQQPNIPAERQLFQLLPRINVRRCAHSPMQGMRVPVFEVFELAGVFELREWILKCGEKELRGVFVELLP
jgi:hypothetical protein